MSSSSSVLLPNPGSVAAIYKGNVDEQPVLQVMSMKKNTVGTKDRWTLLVSDGVNFMSAVAMSQLNSLMTTGQVCEGCLIKLIQYSSENVANRQIILVQEMWVASGPMDTIGQPVEVGSLSSTTSTSSSSSTSSLQSKPSSSSSSSSLSRPQPTQPTQPTQTTQTQTPTPPSLQPTIKRGSGVGVTCTAIRALNQYTNRWFIKARVTSRSALKQFTSRDGKPGSLFNVDLLDADGGELRGVFFHEAAVKWSQLLELNKVYIFPKSSSMKVANRKFCGPTIDYECIWDTGADIMEVDDDSTIQKIRYSFVPLAQLATTPADTTVDVVGIIHHAFPLSSVKIKSSGEDRKRRNVVLMDETQTTIDVTLWGDKAERPDQDYQVGTVLAIRSCRVSDYGTKSLGTVQSSIVEFNPVATLAEARQLKTWFDQQSSGGGQPLKARVSLSSSSSSGSLTGLKTFRNVVDLDDSKSGFCCRATVMLTKRDQERSLWYMACPTEGCHRKAIELTDGRWSCEKCQKHYNEAVPRYMMAVLATDSTGSTYMNMFNDVATKVLGQTATEMKDYKDCGDDESFDQCMENINFKTFVFKVRGRMDTYEGKSRLRVTVHEADPVDFVADSRRMLDDIRKVMVN